MKNMYREVFLSSDFRNPEILEFRSIWNSVHDIVGMKIVMNIWKDIRENKAIDFTR